MAEARTKCSKVGGTDRPLVKAPRPHKHDDNPLLRALIFGGTAIKDVPLFDLDGRFQQPR